MWFPITYFIYIDLHSGDTIKDYVGRKRSVLPIRYGERQRALKLKCKEENDEQEYAQAENFDDIEFLTAEFLWPIKVEREEFEHFDDIHFLFSEENASLPTPFEFKQERDINQMEDLIMLCGDDFVLLKPFVAGVKHEIEDNGYEPIPTQRASPEPEQGFHSDQSLDLATRNQGEVDAISGSMPFKVKGYAINGVLFFGFSNATFWFYCFIPGD